MLDRIRKIFCNHNYEKVYEKEEYTTSNCGACKHIIKKYRETLRGEKEREFQFDKCAYHRTYCKLSSKIASIRGGNGCKEFFPPHKLRAIYVCTKCSKTLELLL